jgi:hypothetical protein
MLVGRTSWSALTAVVGLALVASGAMPRLAFAAARPAATTPADEVVSLQQNPAHTGSATGDALAPPLIQKWAIDVGSGNTISYPLIAGGRIFVTTMSTTGGASSLRAYNATDGSAAWPPIALNGWVTAAYDVVNGQGVVFTRSADNTVKAFSAATGAQLWSVTTYNGTHRGQRARLHQLFEPDGRAPPGRWDRRVDESGSSRRRHDAGRDRHRRLRELRVQPCLRPQCDNRRHRVA